MTNHDEIVWQGSLKNFGPILRRWVALVNRATRHWAPDDCPWWYRERPLVGILSAACWWEGGASIHEFAGQKTAGDGEKYSGRYDSMITLNGERYLVEAKFIFSDCRKGKIRMRREIDALLKKAQSDVEKVEYIEKKRMRRMRRLGVVFSAPVIRVECSPPEALKSLEHWKVAIDQTPCRAYAWTLPNQGWEFKDGDWVHPGVAVLVREK